jgi:tetratricopeptide (TPR) repeat protein
VRKRVAKGRRAKAPAQSGDPDEHFLEARILMDAGRNRAAMEQAGLGVRLDLGRPEGYLLLGELNLREGDLVEARRSFTAAEQRARGAERCAALAGLAHVAALAGDLDGARSAYESALREDDSDPLNLRCALAEVLLGLGDAAGARTVLARCDDDSVDAFVLSGLAHWEAGDLGEAIAAVRRACLANLYLAPLLRGEDVPELGLVPGVEEASAEHAAALIARLEPYLRKRPGAVGLLAGVASAPVAMREEARLVALARELAREPRDAARARLKREIADLRDARRIRSTGAAATEGLAPIQSPPASFEV